MIDEMPDEEFLDFIFTLTLMIGDDFAYDLSGNEDMCEDDELPF